MFILRANFYPEATKEKRRLIKKMRNLGVNVEELNDKMQVHYIGDDLSTIAVVIEIVEMHKVHEITLHEL